MGSVVKEKVKKRKISKSRKATKNKDEIDDLIQEEFRDEEIRQQKQNELDQITRSTALELVNEFIDNETRSSFKRGGNTKKKPTAKAASTLQTAAEENTTTIKAKTKKKKKREKNKDTILEMEEHHNSNETKIDFIEQFDETPPVKSAPKKKTKPKQQMTNKQNWETFDEDTPDQSAASNPEGSTTKKTKPKKAKVNKISPTPQPGDRSMHLKVTTQQQDRQKRKLSKESKNDLILQSFSDDADLDADNSCMTMLLMAISLESELPPKFYAKLLKSKRLKGVLKNMSHEERSLLLAMMSDIEPEVDYLPIRNEIFIDSFKDRLTVFT